MYRLFYFGFVACVVAICMASFIYGDGASAWFCLVVTTLYFVDHGHSHHWHHKIELWWVNFRLNLLEQAMHNSRSEIAYLQSVGRHFDAGGEQCLLAEMTKDRQVFVRRIRWLDATLEAWRSWP